MPLNENQKRILIVGAGPTGLTAAVELARLGIIPKIIDRKDGPSPLSRAAWHYAKQPKYAYTFGCYKTACLGRCET